MQCVPKSKARKKAKKKRSAPPPAPREVKAKGPSPAWYVATMFGLMAIGAILIILNYIGVVPGGTSNSWLIIGLAGIAIGFTMTLNYR